MGVLIILVHNQVDVTGIVDTHLISRMRDGITSLRLLLDEWLAIRCVTEIDWEKLRAFEFQENLRLRDNASQTLASVTCSLCPEFMHHVCPAFMLTP